MEYTELLAFVRAQRWAVQASASVGGTPQAAVIGIAVTDTFEFVFDTLTTSRKAANLRDNPRTSLVVGWDEGQTVQIDGLADEPAGLDLTRLKRVYFERFPDGLEREQLPNLTYFRIVPQWMRFSDFRVVPPSVRAWTEGELSKFRVR